MAEEAPPPPPPRQGGGQANAAPILISPWQGTIDLSTKTGKALWDEGIKSLETKFSGQGKDVVRFLADVHNRVDKCEWHQIITFTNDQDLLNNWGKITKEEVIQARDDRDLIVVTNLQQARPQINALMMFHFLYDSAAEEDKHASCKHHSS